MIILSTYMFFSLKPTLQLCSVPCTYNNIRTYLTPQTFTSPKSSQFCTRTYFWLSGHDSPVITKRWKRSAEFFCLCLYFSKLFHEQISTIILRSWESDGWILARHEMRMRWVYGRNVMINFLTYKQWRHIKGSFANFLHCFVLMAESWRADHNWICVNNPGLCTAVKLSAVRTSQCQPVRKSEVSWETETFH